MLKTLISQPNIIINKLDKSSADTRPNTKLAMLKYGKLFESRNSSNNRAMEEPKFLISKAKKGFSYLKQAFNKLLIL